MVNWREILLIEDNSARLHRRSGNGRRAHAVKISIHRIDSRGCTIISEQSYSPGTLARKFGREGRAGLALKLLDALKISTRTLVVAGPTYGTNADFTAGLSTRGLAYAVEIRPTATARFGRKNAGEKLQPAQQLLVDVRWARANVVVRGAATPEKYCIANLGVVCLATGQECRLFAAQTGRIPGVHRGTIFALTSLTKAPLPALLRAVGWVRWIRPAARRMEKKSLVADKAPKAFNPRANGQINGSGIAPRSNISLAQQADTRAAARPPDSGTAVQFRGRLAARPGTLNVVELFAGAGGMGLGFLLARGPGRRFRLTYSGEINPVYVETLRANHAAFAAQAGNSRRLVPKKVAAVDLAAESAVSQVCRAAREAGKVDVLIGGPPCQGFSNANRNSWHSSNPNNRLVDVFLRYVEALHPKVFVMENVQGIMWTPKSGRTRQQPSVLEHLARRMEAAGYTVFPKLLDAVWYGVPQHRSRFFLLGLSKELGYGRDDFGEWGPFPRPSHGPGCPNDYVTLDDALRDLPVIGNGESLAVRPYSPGAGSIKGNPFLAQMREGAPRKTVSDHITSRHADYVIERYRRIPAGGNWEDIASSLTNYTNVSRTHSNIYRRLEWSKPAITIGHYRKSMLVHPDQDRGFSLREASRLQSFPDWFRFAGGGTRDGGLVHKQQQLANAVCPLVTKALAEHILKF